MSICCEIKWRLNMGALIVESICMTQRLDIWGKLLSLLFCFCRRVVIEHNATAERDRHLAQARRELVSLTIVDYGLTCTLTMQISAQRLQTEREKQLHQLLKQKISAEKEHTDKELVCYSHLRYASKVIHLWSDPRRIAHHCWRPGRRNHPSIWHTRAVTVNHFWSILRVYCSVTLQEWGSCRMRIARSRNGVAMMLRRVHDADDDDDDADARSWSDGRIRGHLFSYLSPAYTRQNHLKIKLQWSPSLQRMVQLNLDGNALVSCVTCNLLKSYVRRRAREMDSRLTPKTGTPSYFLRREEGPEKEDKSFTEVLAGFMWQFH